MEWLWAEWMEREIDVYDEDHDHPESWFELAIIFLPWFFFVAAN